MIIVFTKSRNIGSFLIQLVTWSSWSHVAIVNANSVQEISENTEIIDSTFLHGGVKKRTIKELLHPASKWAYVTIPGTTTLEAWSAALTQVGKKYDTTGILGIAFRRNWSNGSKWFCNELVEWVIACVDKPRFIEDLWRLTPQHSWMLNTNVQPTIRYKKDGYIV